MLSQARADSVVRWLSRKASIRAGCARGFGQTRPIATNWIGPGGQILKHEFQKKSGNAFFDQALELAIQRTKLPPPPAEIAKSLRDTGVVLNFKP